jgi:amidase
LDAVFRLPKERRVFALAADAPPALRVPDGALVELQTADCFSDQIRSADDSLGSVDWEQINPATGPVDVEGARPGDVLAVTVEHIEVARQGVMAVSDEFGVLAGRFAGTECRIVPIVGGRARLADGVEVPVRAMIGVIGIAPAGEPVSTGTPGSHGGNLDTKLIGEGATVYLPVSVDGALLAAGDLHAAMGDGEICGTGVEVAGSVTLRVTVRRDLALEDPVVATPDVVATVASAPSLDAAAEAATRDMADLLQGRLGLSPADATMLMSVAGDLQVSQIVDPLRTARFALPVSILAQYGRPLL